MSPLRVGFIGLGNMGILMAKTLVKNKVPLTIFDVRKEPLVQMQAMGAKVEGSSREVGAASDVVISVVRDESQNEEAIFGKDGILEGIKPGGAIVISSTISPAYCRSADSRTRAKGVYVIDAAISTESRNFTPGQESAVFTLMVGGDKQMVEKCQPVFEGLTRNIFYMGVSGSGAACKLVNNLAMYGNSIVARECLNLGLKAGLDLDKMLEAIRLSTGYSRGINLVARSIHQPRRAPKPESPPVKSLEEKDNETAVELAESVGAKTPVSKFMFGLDLEKEYEALNQEGVREKKK